MDHDRELEPTPRPAVDVAPPAPAQTPGRAPDAVRPGHRQDPNRLIAASSRADAAFNRVIATFREAYVPFQTAYREMQTVLARQQHIHQARQQFVLDILFQGLAGGVGGIVQQALRARIGTSITRREAAAATPPAPATQPARLGEPMTPQTTLGARAAPAPAAAPAASGASAVRPNDRVEAVGPSTAAGDVSKYLTRLGSLLLQSEGGVPTMNEVVFEPMTWLQRAIAAIEFMKADVSDAISGLATAASSGQDFEVNPEELVQQFVARVSAMQPSSADEAFYLRGLWESWIDPWLAEVRTEPELQLVLDHDSLVRRSIEGVPGGAAMLERKLAGVRQRIAANPARPPQPGGFRRRTAHGTGSPG